MTLSGPAERVAFFRALGRAYAPVASTALGLALLRGLVVALSLVLACLGAAIVT